MANLIREGSRDGDPLTADFKNFLWRVHKELGYTAPTPLQYDMCDFLQENVGTEFTPGRIPDRKVLMGFRGVAKSHITTGFAVWRLKRDRRHHVLVTSATGRFAGIISNFAFQMVNNFSWLADMKPGADQRQSAIGFDVAGCPPAQQHESFASVSITGQITGRRATIAIGDDLETPNTSETEAARDDLFNRVSEIGGAIIVPGGDIYNLGTAQTEDTLYLKQEQRGYTLRIYPIMYPRPDADPKKDELKHYGSRLAPFIENRLRDNPLLAGTSTEPSRFNEADIMARQNEWGRTEFERQFKMWMDAGQGRGNPLRLRDIPVIEVSKPLPTTPHILLPTELIYSPGPACKVDIEVDAMTGDGQVYAPVRMDIWVKPEEVICYVDPSGEGKDETTWTIAAGLEGRVYVLYQGYSTEGHSNAVLKEIAKDCREWRVTTVKVESNFGQGMFGDLLLPEFKLINHMVAIEDDRQGKVAKEKRIIETLEPLITAHRLILCAGVLRRDFHVDYEHVEAEKRRFHRLTYQLTRMTKQKGCVKHDDRVDGLSGAAKHFVGVLARVLQEAADRGRVKAIEEEAEAMIEARRKAGLPLFGLEKGPPALGRPRRRTH